MSLSLGFWTRLSSSLASRSLLFATPPPWPFCHRAPLSGVSRVRWSPLLGLLPVRLLSAWCGFPLGLWSHALVCFSRPAAPFGIPPPFPVPPGVPVLPSLWRPPNFPPPFVCVHCLLSRLRSLGVVHLLRSSASPWRSRLLSSILRCFLVAPFCSSLFSSFLCLRGRLVRLLSVRLFVLGLASLPSAPSAVARFSLCPASPLLVGSYFPSFSRFRFPLPRACFFGPCLSFLPRRRPRRCPSGRALFFGCCLSHGRFLVSLGLQSRVSFLACHSPAGPAVWVRWVFSGSGPALPPRRRR